MPARWLLVAVLVAASGAPPLAGSNQGGPGVATTVQVRVNGQPVALLQPVTRFADEWFVPLAPVATALGAALRITSAPTRLQVLRGDGAVVTFDPISGRVMQGLILLGETPHFREVTLGGNPDAIAFPLGGMTILLGITARFDAERNMIAIESLDGASTQRPGMPGLQSVSQDYTYSFTTNGDVNGQYTQMRGEEWVRGTRLRHEVLLNRLPGDTPRLTYGSLRLERPARQFALTLGDQGTFSGLDAMGNTIRGIGLEQSVGRWMANAHGGLAVGSVVAAIGSSGQANYDTDYLGLSLRRRTARTELAMAGNAFQGNQREGRAMGLSYSAAFGSHRLRAQGLYGQFAGANARATPVDGPGYGVGANHTFASKQGRAVLVSSWERYSESFLTVRPDSRFSGMTRSAVSTTVRPLTNVSLTAGLTAQQELVGSQARNRGYNVGGSITGPKALPLQAGYFRSIQSNDSIPTGRVALTQYSLILPHFKRYSASASLSTFEIAGSNATTIGAEASADYGRLGRLGVHDQYQRDTSHRYGIEWTWSRGGGDTQLRIALDRLQEPGAPALLAPQFSGSLPLPWHQRLNLTYTEDRGMRVFQVQLSGPLGRSRQLVGEFAGGRTTLVVPATVSGQIYHDANLDDRFDAGQDRRLAGIYVWLDEERSTVTDASGNFRFDDVGPGSHRLRAGLDSLPASLIFRNGDARLIAVTPYGANRQDFSAIPTGHVSGRIIVTSVTGLESEPLALPLADVRVIATGDRDAYSNAEGRFTASDLPPGTFELRIDPATLPPGFVVTPPVHTVVVKPGSGTPDVVFRVGRAIVRK